MNADYNPFDPATIENPYPAYAELRVKAAVHAHLARLQMRETIAELYKRVSSIEYAGDPVRSPNFMLRGLSSMPVRLEARRVDALVTNHR